LTPSDPALAAGPFRLYLTGKVGRPIRALEHEAEMIRTRGLTHVALTVSDAERAFRFYERVFGAVATYRERGLIQAQTPGAWDVLVFEEHSTRAKGTGGIVHFGFRLMSPDDIEAAAAEVRDAGGTVLEQGEFVPGEPYLFCRDPDGYEVEIWYEIPTSADPR
jgi:catechol 2,3-dioxygenase-like lactoylglutathione lyase family enzyme